MDIILDVVSKKIDGASELIWKNPSGDTIKALYFHLYYNAFKNSQTTFFKERGVPDWLTRDIDETCGWGWTHISEFSDNKNNDLTGKMYYVQPDDDNIGDQTVLKVTLDNPILPFDVDTFHFKWQAKVPKTMPRTGFNKDFYFFAQWFPKVGVYEPAGMRFTEVGQWNCHQYHSSGEYYADFGNYDVKMTLPKEYIVASSGELAGQEKTGDLLTWHFKGHDIIDFTWTCSPHYVIHKDTYASTEILLYTYPYKAHLKDRYLPTIKFCMEYLDKHLGTYPYASLSIVDPPIHGMFTGGMEYPTLITSLSFCFFPKGIKTPETLVVHEFIHQYFMQMVATHEVEETWMDEGITTYYEGRILDAYLGEHTSTINFMGVQCGNKEFNRAEFFGSGNATIAPNSIKSWQYTHGGYGDIAYNKTALWLQTLEGLIGIEVMDKCMKTYFEKWKFKHPSRNDFIKIFNEIVTQELPHKYPNGMNWFFDQAIFGTEMCDYKIRSISNVAVKNPSGFLNDFDDCEGSGDALTRYTNKVIIERVEGMKLPVDVIVTFDDGSHSLHHWSGEERSFDITLESNKKIVKAEVDPNRKIVLDKNYINNAMTVESQKGAQRSIINRIIFKLQHVMESLTLFI